MNTLQIIKALANDAVSRRFFYGCFPSDKLPSGFSIYPACFVANTLPSNENNVGHWICMYCSSDSMCYYFDSLASPPVENITAYLSKFHTVVTNIVPFQSIVSNVCGEYALLVLFYMCKGYSLQKICCRLAKMKNRDAWVRLFCRARFKF